MAELITASLRRYLDGVAAQGLVPGVSLAVVHGPDSQLYHTGLAQTYPTARPLAADELYDMASLTKVVVTTSLGLIALDRGCFGLDDKVAAHLPAFRHGDVTIRDLWTHVSGLAADDRRYRQAATPDQLLDFICRLDKVYPTGSQVVYSDFNFILLGCIIAQGLGPLDEAFAELIAKPLGMKDTGYRPADRGLADRCAATEDEPDRGGVIRGVVHDGKGYRMGGVSGNAGLFATAAEMVPFVRMMLDHGRYGGRTVIPARAIALLDVCYTEGLGRRRTLGWYLYDPQAVFGKHCAHDCLLHTGFTGTSIYIDRQRDAAVVLLTNRVHPHRDNDSIAKIRDDVHDMVLTHLDAGAC